MDNEPVGAGVYDGVPAAELTHRLGFPVFVYDSVPSTLDVAHEYATRSRGESALVLADTQTAGRGRSGHRWSSPPGRGVWLTLLERSVARGALDVLSLRVGIRAARALDVYATEPVRLKWPNDLYVEGGKLGGTLVEVRWRHESPEWVAIGLGVNVRAPDDQSGATGLEVGVNRVDVLTALVEELKGVASAPGGLTAGELDEFDARDLARGKVCVEPVRGRVRGLTSAGELLVELADTVVRVRHGSLVLE